MSKHTQSGWKSLFGGSRTRAATGSRAGWLAPLAWLIVAFIAAPAQAAIDLRVEARPVADPIQAFVTVTDANGQPVSGLTAANFTLLVDGNPISSTPTFSLPPDVGSQRVSVVFAMDFSNSVQVAARQAMENSVITFINSMKDGDYAAIVKFNNSNPNRASVVQPFTQIGDGTRALIIDAVKADYPGFGTNLYDAVVLSVQQFEAATTLPNGPKAIVLVSDGGENSSTADVNAALSAANGASIPLFTVGVGETDNTNEALLQLLATETSGDYFPAPDDQTVADAYLTISELLKNEYLLTFVSPIVDCGTHTLEVRVNVGGQTESATQAFTRCTPLIVPDLAGRTLAAATTALTNVGLVLGSTTQQTSATVPAGRVISQSPASGTSVSPGAIVNVVVSSGPPPGTVPQVVGLTQAAATSAITGVQLVVGTVTQQSSSSVPAGTVISQSPVAGQVLAVGSAVSLVVSSGPPQVAVPTVTGLTQSAATAAITGASLVVGSVTQQTSSTVPSGSVISQTPGAGTQVTAGTSVSLVVSSGPAPTSNPPPASGKKGGGGATGLFEILAGLALLGLARRRRGA